MTRTGSQPAVSTAVASFCLWRVSKRRPPTRRGGRLGGRGRRVRGGRRRVNLDAHLLDLREPIILARLLLLTTFFLRDAVLRRRFIPIALLRALGPGRHILERGGRALGRHPSVLGARWTGARASRRGRTPTLIFSVFQTFLVLASCNVTIIDQPTPTASRNAFSAGSACAASPFADNPL